MAHKNTLIDAQALGLWQLLKILQSFIVLKWLLSYTHSGGMAVHFTCFIYPCPVAIQLPLNLLLPPEFHECPSIFHSLSLFGKFPVKTERLTLKVDFLLSSGYSLPTLQQWVVLWAGYHVGTCLNAKRKRELGHDRRTIEVKHWSSMFKGRVGLPENDWDL